MVCGYFILPEPASYVFFYAIFNLRNLFYLIHHYEDIGSGVYKVYVEIGGKVVPFVAVDSATGEYHG